MKMKSMALVFAMLATASSAYAGDFVHLRDDLANLTVGNGGLVNGINNPRSDKFYLDATNINWLAGYDNPEDNPGNLVATSITYKAHSTTAPYGVVGNGVLTLLDYKITSNVVLVPGVAQATIFDFVFQDSRDNSLVFGTRYINEVDNNQEVNFLYRYGFEGYSASAAWLYLSDYDLNLYQSGRTDDHSFGSSVAYDADAIRFKSDVSASEGNPNSGLYLVKTDATSYVWGDKAIGFYQAGEEGQAVVGGSIGGFIPTTVAAVPEPSEYALMLLGLGMVGFVATRRKKHNLA